MAHPQDSSISMVGPLRMSGLPREYVAKEDFVYFPTERDSHRQALSISGDRSRSRGNHPFEPYRHPEMSHGAQGYVFRENPPRDSNSRCGVRKGELWPGHLPYSAGGYCGTQAPLASPFSPSSSQPAPAQRVSFSSSG